MITLLKIIQMVTDIRSLDPDKMYTYADYLKWKFQERIELIRGRIFRMSPAPRVLHQEISMFLCSQIYYFLNDKPCKVFSAPFDVRFTKTGTENETIKTVVQPDVSVICDLSRLDEFGCVGAPDLIVEILSPGNNTKELKLKYQIYEENGVREYWVIHPDEKTFLAYTLDANGKFQPSALKTIGDVVTTEVLPGFQLDLAKMFNY